MSAGQKHNPLSPRPPKTMPGESEAPVHKDAAAHADSSEKPGKPEHKAVFAQGAYYRQGVLVPGGPRKGAIPRSRNR